MLCMDKLRKVFAFAKQEDIDGNEDIFQRTDDDDVVDEQENIEEIDRLFNEVLESTEFELKRNRKRKYVTLEDYFDFKDQRANTDFGEFLKKYKLDKIMMYPRQLINNEDTDD